MSNKMNNILSGILFASGFALLVGCGKKPVFRTIEAAVAGKVAAKKQVVVLDIRTPAEYAEGHLPKAVNVDFLDSSFQQKIQVFDKQKKYLVYCRTGNKSAKAMDEMKAMGFVNLTQLKEGFSAWKGPINRL